MRKGKNKENEPIWTKSCGRWKGLVLQNQLDFLLLLLLLLFLFIPISRLTLDSPLKVGRDRLLTSWQLIGGLSLQPSSVYALPMFLHQSWPQMLFSIVPKKDTLNVRYCVSILKQKHPWCDVSLIPWREFCGFNGSLNGLMVDKLIQLDV